MAIDQRIDFNQLKNFPFLNIKSRSYYDFSISPGVALVASINIVTLNPMPPGLAVGNNVYIDDGGSSELVTITALSTTQASFTCIHTHSGAYIIRTATKGLLECSTQAGAISGLGAATYILVEPGIFIMDDTLNLPHYTSLIGAGSNSTYFYQNFTAKDLIYVGDSTTTLNGNGQILKDFHIFSNNGVTVTAGYAIHCKLRYNVTLENITIGDPGGILAAYNGVFMESCLTFSLFNVKINGFSHVGLEVAGTGGNQCAGRMVLTDVVSPGNVLYPLVYFHGNVLSMYIDGLQMQGGFYNWQILTDSGAFTESQISNVIFDSAHNTAFHLSGTGNTFKINISNICLSTVSGVDNMLGMVFDGTGAGVFSDFTITGVTGGVNSSNGIGTAIFVANVGNFILTSSQLQGAGQGTGDTVIQIQGTTYNVCIFGNVLGYNYTGDTSFPAPCDRAVYVPSGTHNGMSVKDNNIYGNSSCLVIAGVHNLSSFTGNSLRVGAGGVPSSWTGTGTANFDNLGEYADSKAAASAVNSPFSKVIITGHATAIATLSNPTTGQRKRLIFTDSAPLGVTTGGNIARVQAAVQYQAIDFTYDGTTALWY